VPSFTIPLAMLADYFAAAASFEVVINAAIEYERTWQARCLPQLHGGFSGAAAVGALTAGALLSAGVPFRGICWLVTVVYVALAIAVRRGLARPLHVSTAAGGGLARCRRRGGIHLPPGDADAGTHAGECGLTWAPGRCAARLNGGHKQAPVRKTGACLLAWDWL